jgi:tetratricopeptide (TPR) repeat protein
VVPLAETTHLLLARAGAEGRALAPARWEDTLRWAWAALASDSGESGRLLRVEELWPRPGLDKSWGEAERSRRTATRAYAEGRLGPALAAYSRALALAPPAGGQVPLLLANRALVLLEQGAPGRALEELRLAEEAGYPAARRHKLLARRAVCLATLGRAGEAEVRVASIQWNQENTVSTKYCVAYQMSPYFEVWARTAVTLTCP